MVFSLEQTDDGGYILAVNIISSNTHKNEAWLIKTDADGNKVWDKTFTHPTMESYVYDVHQTSDKTLAQFPMIIC